MFKGRVLLKRGRDIIKSRDKFFLSKVISLLRIKNKSYIDLSIYYNVDSRLYKLIIDLKNRSR
jgi:hypothetical protein